MERVISKLQSIKNWKEELRKICRRNKLNTQIVSYFTPLRFRNSFQRFIEVHNRKGQSRGERWLQNELKAFYWFIIALSFADNQLISQFGQQQWATMHQIFIFKTLMTLKYQAQKIISEIKPQKPWNIDQQNIFKQIMRSQTQFSNRWNQKARQLYQLSNGQYLRSGKQCREKWLNHLDPSKNHGGWNIEEEIRFVSLLLEKGRKWSKIARELESNRTEHMVKNRYKTIMGRLRKQHPEIKDQDKLLNIFISDHQISNKSVDDKQQDHLSPQLQNGREIVENQPIQSIQNREGLGEIYHEDSNHKIEEQNEEEVEENKDKVEVEVDKFRGNSGLDLGQVYSPWIGMPATPSFTPNFEQLFINNFNFTSYDNILQNNFYNQDQPKQ